MIKKLSMSKLGMKKFFSLNIASLVIFLAFSFMAYYFLTRDNFLPTSISSIIAHSHDLEVTKHLIVLGLLPFYIAAVIFGTAILSFYLSAMIRRSFRRWLKRPKNTSPTAPEKIPA